MENIKKNVNLKKLLIFFGILFLFLTLDYFLVIGYYSFDDLVQNTIKNSVVFVIIKYIILAIIIFFQYHNYLKEKWFDYIKNIKKYFEISFKYWLLGFIIMIVSNIIINYISPGLGKNEETVQLLIKRIPLIAFLLTTVFAPFIEEMIFRKYLQDSFNNKYLFMILSGLLFGFVHVMGYNNPLEYLLIIPYGALGFMFAKTINETDNIYCTIMMHMLHNGVFTLLSILVV